MRCRAGIPVALAVIALAVIALASGALDGRAQAEVKRYRVEQVIRLETTSAVVKPLPGRVRATPTQSAVEARVRFVLEQKLEEGQTPPRGVWRFREVEVEGPRAEPAETTNPGVERVFTLGLEWMRRLEGQDFSGFFEDVPMFPLGEAPPPWMTSWLRWAQLGSFAGVDGSSLINGREDNPPRTRPAYQIQWLRSEFRRVPCHVQLARWVAPVAPAPESVPAELAAEGVEARTHFSAQSLEWVSQENPGLIYAERSGVRETYWTLEKVQKPELQELVFRLRLVVQVRVERMP